MGAGDRVLVAYHFDRSADGWVIATDTQQVAATFHAEGGQRGGYITGTDEALGETWYFEAPPDLLRQLPGADGGTLRYSLKQSEPATDFADDDVVIQGPAGRLSYRFRTPPGQEWVEYRVRLTASEGWRWNWNADATDEQMRRVLREATALRIRGEFVTGHDTGSLDSVVLSSR